jgi:hypothetical protein
MADVPTVLWTTRSPDPLSTELSALGFTVWEALAFSEVTYLCETEKIDIIILTADVDEGRARELKQRFITIKLHSNVLSPNVVSTLWQLFPNRSMTLQ